MADAEPPGTTTRAPHADCNTIRLEGRVSAAPQVKDLPSGERLVVLKVVVRRPDPRRVDSLPVVVGPPPELGRRRGPDQAGRRTVALAARLAVDDRVEVAGTLQRHFWAAEDGRRSRLQVRASELRRVDGRRAPRRRT